jgi:hypothetical protein
VQALDLGDCEFEVVLSEEKPRVLVGAEEIQRICAKQEVFSKSDLIQSLKLSLKNWRVWALFVVQFSTFGGGVSSLSIWGPTFFEFRSERPIRLPQSSPLLLAFAAVFECFLAPFLTESAF